MPGGQIAPDVPELLEIVLARTLGDFRAERGIAARPGLPLEDIPALLRFGPGKEKRCQIPRPRDQRRVDAVIADQRARLRDLERQEAELVARLSSARGRQGRLLSALQMISRRPPPPPLTSPST